MTDTGEAFLRRRGSAKYAEIHVTYPAGLVCTCTKGTKVLTAENTSGTWTFYVPYAGTWTVRAGSSSTRNVSITARHQSVHVVFRKNLVTNSAFAAGVTFTGRYSPEQWEQYRYIGFFASEGQVYTSIEDIEGYTKLRGKCNTYTSGKLMVADSRGNILESTNILPVGEFREYSVSLSGLSGSVRVGFAEDDVAATDIWLEGG